MRTFYQILSTMQRFTMEGFGNFKEIFKVRFCRIRRFRVRVWVSYRTYRSSGLGYKTLTELTKVPGIVVRAYLTHRSSGQV